MWKRIDKPVLLVGVSLAVIGITAEPGLAGLICCVIGGGLTGAALLEGRR